jgi:hypothetical protein
MGSRSAGCRNLCRENSEGTLGHQTLREYHRQQLAYLPMISVDLAMFDGTVSTRVRSEDNANEEKCGKDWEFIDWPTMPEPIEDRPYARSMPRMLCHLGMRRNFARLFPV